MAYFALVPAAGTGTRMGGGLPKQYLPLAGRPLIHHALATLCAVPEILAVFVVLAARDEEWQRYDWATLGGKLEVLRCGGETRAESVCNGLRDIAPRAAKDDWVLVHDAARPCLSVRQVRRLIGEAGHDPVGGILAMPLADTLKRAHEDSRIAATVPRERLWAAQTPQMFRHGQLLEALAAAPGVTDEAGAIEAMGLQPRLVAGDASNFKVTYPDDLALAGWILAGRNET